MLKHVYFEHPDTVFLDEQNGSGVYCGLYDVTQEQIDFGHVAKPGEGIQIDQGKKAAWLRDNPPPMTMTPRQARLALNHFGLRETVEAGIAGADQNTKDEWEFANEVVRDWPPLIAMAESLGMTNKQLDDIFIYGKDL